MPARRSPPPPRPIPATQAPTCCAPPPSTPPSWTESFDGTDSGGLAKPATFAPVDPLEPLGNPAQDAPIPPELGAQVPQPPLQNLPPLRFLPNQFGQDPAPEESPTS